VPPHIDLTHVPTHRLCLRHASHTVPGRRTVESLYCLKLTFKHDAIPLARADKSRAAEYEAAQEDLVIALVGASRRVSTDLYRGRFADYAPLFRQTGCSVQIALILDVPDDVFGYEARLKDALREGLGYHMRGVPTFGDYFPGTKWEAGWVPQGNVGPGCRWATQAEKIAHFFRWTAGGSEAARFKRELLDLSMHSHQILR